MKAPSFAFLGHIGAGCIFRHNWSLHFCAKFGVTTSKHGNFDGLECFSEHLDFLSTDSFLQVPTFLTFPPSTWDLTQDLKDLNLPPKFPGFIGRNVLLILPLHPSLYEPSTPLISSPSSWNQSGDGPHFGHHVSVRFLIPRLTPCSQWFN
jgi:hypothetical protein